MIKSLYNGHSIETQGSLYSGPPISMGLQFLEPPRIPNSTGAETLWIWCQPPDWSWALVGCGGFSKFSVVHSEACRGCMCLLQASEKRPDRIVKQLQCGLVGPGAPFTLGFGTHGFWNPLVPNLWILQARLDHVSPDCITIIKWSSIYTRFSEGLQ